MPVPVYNHIGTESQIRHKIIQQYVYLHAESNICSHLTIHAHGYFSLLYSVFINVYKVYIRLIFIYLRNIEVVSFNIFSTLARAGTSAIYSRVELRRPHTLNIQRQTTIKEKKSLKEQKQQNKV